MNYICISIGSLVAQQGYCWWTRPRFFRLQEKQIKQTPTAPLKKEQTPRSNVRQGTRSAMALPQAGAQHKVWKTKINEWEMRGDPSQANITAPPTAT